jgi:hypothetical protein
MDVVHDTADVIVFAEDEVGGERLRIDAIDVALAVRTVLADRHPDESAIVINAAGVRLGNATRLIASLFKTRCFAGL